MKLVMARFGLAWMAFLFIFLLSAHTASAAYLIGWQTYSNCGANNNSGICDASPESNSTYDATPVGGIGTNNTYLTGVIGTGASSLGRKGRGQNQNNQFLNGAGFGNETADSNRLITAIPMADGTTPGERIGAYNTTPQGAPNGTSSWKFSTSGNERTGDIRVTNESDYYFRLQFVHFDARVGNANAPQNLEIKYLSGDGTAYDNALLRKDNGSELVNLNNIYNNDFGPGPAAFNVSHSIGGVIGTQAYLAPGESVALRFVWTDFATDGAESQLDNIAIEGQFFETQDLLVEVDPTAVPAAVPGPAAALWWALSSSLLGVGFLQLRRFCR